MLMLSFGAANPQASTRVCKLKATVMAPPLLLQPMHSVTYNRQVLTARPLSFLSYPDTTLVALTIFTVIQVTPCSKENMLMCLAINHHGAELLPNNTIQGGTISHVGQFCAEQNFLGQVEKTSPYNTNKQVQTLNAQDALFNISTQGGDDLVLKISLIGNKIGEGLYATIDVGVNPKAKQSPQPVGFWTKKGGVPVPGSPWTGYPDICKCCGFHPPKEKKHVTIEESE